MDSQVSSQDYFSAFRRRRPLMLGIAIPIFLISLMLALGLPDVYRSSGLIEIQGQGQRSEYLQQSPSREEPSYADQYVSSLKGQVLSDANLRKLAEKHQLYPDNPDTATAVKRLRKDINVAIVTVPILDPRTGREREVVTAFTAAYENRIPQNAQLGANWLVDEFLNANRGQHSERASSASAFFGTEAERMGQHIAQLESKLADFKQSNFGRLPELTEVNMASMDRTERELESTQLQMRTLRQDRVFLTSQLQQALSANPEQSSLAQLEAEYQRKATQYDESHPDLVSMRRQIESLRRGGSVGSGSLQSQLEGQRSVLAEARQRYSADHPDIKRMQREIASLEARIASGERSSASAAGQTPVSMQLQTQISAIDTQLAGLSARSAELRAKLAQVESSIVSTPQVEQEYQTLTRDLNIARTKYEELLRRQMDAQISEAAISGGRADDFRLVQQPLLPAAPAKPARAAIALIGFIIALVLAFSAALLVEAVNPMVRGARDIRDILQVSALAAVPEIRNSISRRRQFKRMTALAASMLIGVSAAFYIIRLVVG